MRRKSAATGGPRVRVRVDLAPGCSIGPGKISLLEAIDREGSLSLAARSIDMSYRRAWLLLDDLNRSFVAPVVATAIGGRRGGGARVTDHGHELIRAFRALERGATRLASSRLRKVSARTQSSGGKPRRVNGRLRG